MVEIRHATAEELRACVRLALDAPGTSVAELEAQVGAVLSHNGQQDIRPGRQLVAAEGDRLIAGSLCIRSPGRTAAVFVSSVALRRPIRPHVVELLRCVKVGAAQDGVRLLQSLLPPDRHEDEQVFADAGFERLTELLYLVCDVRKRLPGARPPPPAGWVQYGPQTHRLFAETIAETYRDSLDCPRLTGLRDIEDVIDGHKAAGEFDPARWFVYVEDGTPVGVLLLAGVPLRSGLEVVYMGIIPHARGRGLGRRVLHHAVRVARRCGASQLTLAVDGRNTPALALYRSASFREVGRRQAWISVLAESGASEGFSGRM